MVAVPPNAATLIVSFPLPPVTLAASMEVTVVVAGRPVIVSVAAPRVSVAPPAGRVATRVSVPPPPANASEPALTSPLPRFMTPPASALPNESATAALPVPPVASSAPVRSRFVPANTVMPRLAPAAAPVFPVP